LDLSTFVGRSGDLGDGLAVPGDNDFLSGLDSADEFGEAIFGFRYAYIHAIIIAIIYGHGKDRRPGRFLLTVILPVCRAMEQDHRCVLEGESQLVS
jgi:hypothetical protein